jgi:hypothetical protein
VLHPALRSSPGSSHVEVVTAGADPGVQRGRPEGPVLTGAPAWPPVRPRPTAPMTANINLPVLVAVPQAIHSMLVLTSGAKKWCTADRPTTIGNRHCVDPIFNFWDCSLRID